MISESRKKQVRDKDGRMIYLQSQKDMWEESLTELLDPPYIGPKKYFF